MIRCSKVRPPAVPTDIKIETGIPLPTEFGKGIPRYPWKSMKVGDSFSVPTGESGEGPQTYSGERASGFRFTKRKLIEGNPPREVWRVWRIE